MYFIRWEFSLLVFVFPCLLFLTPNHSIFIYWLPKTLSSHFRKRQNKTKTRIKMPQNPLIKLSAKFGIYFHVNLGLCAACCTIIFIWDLNILEEWKPSFLLSCHFPPWKWRAYGRHPPWILKQQEGPDFNSYILSSVTLGIFCSCKAKDVIRICHTDRA